MINCFEHNWDLITACAFLQERLRGQSHVLAVGRHSSVHTCKDDVLTACAWAAPSIKLKELHQKEQKQVSIKRFLKRNLADVGIAQCMNALANKILHIQTRSAMHSITWPLIQQPSLLSSSCAPVGTNFSATNVGWLLNMWQCML